MKNKSCIIIGSEGYLGKHIVHYAGQYGFEIAGCHDISPQSENPVYSSINITDKESLEKINVDVDCIFMFSGLTGTYAGFDNYEKYVAINETGLLNLLDIMRRRQSKARIIFPSTRLVYKGVDQQLKEDDEKEQKTIYAVNKLACEAYLKIYANSFGIPFTIYRICVPYGNEISGDYSFGTIGFFLKNAKSGNPITLYGGGVQKRTFTHVADICRQILSTASLSESKNEIYNIGGETFSLREAAEIVNRRYGVEIKGVEWPEKDLLIESGDTYFDDSKIRSLIDYTITKSLKEIEF